LGSGREEREEGAEGAAFGVVEGEPGRLPALEAGEVRACLLRGGLAGTTSKSKSLT
jgi:hypothetical protein